MRQKFRCQALNLLLLTLCYAYTSESHAQEAFTLQGTFTNYKGPLYLDWDDHVDTAVVENGRFQFKGNLSVPLRATIKINTLVPMELNRIFLEAGETEIAIDTAIARQGNVVKCVMDIRYVKSGPINAVIAPFEKKLVEDVPRLMLLSEDEQLKSFLVDIRKLFRDNPNSPGPVFYLVQTGMYEALPRETLDSLYKGLPKAYQENYFGQRVKERLEYLKRLVVGNTIRDFTWTDAAGHAVSISHYKGKYLFIDVWASWCKPCVAEMPLVKDLHTHYSGSQFAVVGVSIDADRDRWLKALEKYQQPWKNVLDPRHFDAEFLTEFRVNSIPFNLLLDPQGKIVAVNLHGEEPKTKLAEVLKGKL
jgi:thiol-disulfide isomerase/thioredoxin